MELPDKALETFQQPTKIHKLQLSCHGPSLQLREVDMQESGKVTKWPKLLGSDNFRNYRFD